MAYTYDKPSTAKTKTSSTAQGGSTVDSPGVGNAAIQQLLGMNGTQTGHSMVDGTDPLHSATMGPGKAADMGSVGAGGATEMARNVTDGGFTGWGAVTDTVHGVGATMGSSIPIIREAGRRAGEALVDVAQSGAEIVANAPEWLDGLPNRALRAELARLRLPGDTITIALGGFFKVEAGVDGDLTAEIELLEGRRFKSAISVGGSALFEPELGATGLATASLEGGGSLGLAVAGEAVFANVDDLVRSLTLACKSMEPRTGPPGIHAPGLDEADLAELVAIRERGGGQTMQVAGDLALEIGFALGLLKGEGDSQLLGLGAELGLAGDLGLGIELTPELGLAAVYLQRSLSGTLSGGLGVGLSGAGADLGAGRQLSGEGGLELQSTLRFTMGPPQTVDIGGRSVDPIISVLGRWFPGLAGNGTSDGTQLGSIEISPIQQQETVRIEVDGSWEGGFIGEAGGGRRIIIEGTMPADYQGSPSMAVLEALATEHTLEAAVAAAEGVGMKVTVIDERYVETGLELAPEFTVQGVGVGGEGSYNRQNILERRTLHETT